MNRDDDDDLSFDLHAWEAPPPPRNLADVVIARTHATDEAIGIAVRQHRRRYAVIGGTAAVTLAASFALWLGVRGGPAADGRDVAADGPRHVAFEGATADLEPGAALHTYSVGDTLRVVQSGTATWQVADGARIAIDAGSAASIEATGASLRVEATMNRMDARVGSVAALTAVAVAGLTVTVYRGHVNAVDSSPTALNVETYGDGVIAPGETISFSDLIAKAKPMKPSGAAPTLRVADLKLRAGESATIHDASGGVNVEIDAPCDATLAFDDKTLRSPSGILVFNPRTGPARQHVAPLQNGLYAYTATCDAEKPPIDYAGTISIDGSTGHEPGRIVASETPVVDAVYTASGAQITVTVALRGDHSVWIGETPMQELAFNGDSVTRRFMMIVPTTPAPIVVRVAGAQTEFFVLRTATGRAATVAPAPVVPAPVAPTAVVPAAACDEVSCVINNYAGSCCAKFKASAPCDPDADDERAGTAEAEGDHATALKFFTKAWKCAPTPHRTGLAFMTACNASNVRQARVFWQKLSTEEQTHMVIMCIRHQITREMLDAENPPQR